MPYGIGPRRRMRLRPEEKAAPRNSHEVSFVGGQIFSNGKAGQSVFPTGMGAATRRKASAAHQISASLRLAVRVHPTMISINSERLWEREIPFFRSATGVGLDPCTPSQIYRIRQLKFLVAASEHSHPHPLVIDKYST